LHGANATSVNWTRLSFRTAYGPSVTRVGGDGSRQLYVAFREHVGVDNRPYLAYQILGSSTWYGWTSVPTGGGLYGPLGFAVAGSGRMQLAGRAVGTNAVAFTELDSNGNSLFGRWTADVTQWQTHWASV